MFLEGFQGEECRGGWGEEGSRDSLATWRGRAEVRYLGDGGAEESYPRVPQELKRA